MDCNNEVKIEEIMGLEQEWKDAFILGANKIFIKKLVEADMNS